MSETRNPDCEPEMNLLDPALPTPVLRAESTCASRFGGGSDWRATRGVVLFALAAAGLVGITHGQQREFLPADQRTNGHSTVAAVGPIVETVAGATVEVLHDKDRVGLGTVVGPRGEILGKASELAEPVMVRLHDGRVLPARIAAKDTDSDLALLRVDADGLQTAGWPALRGVAVGQWVTAPLPGTDPWLGVVGAAVRPIERAGGALGVRLASGRGSEEGAVTIAEVYPDSAAAAAGLLEGDRIRAVDREPVGAVDALIERIKRRNPGDQVHLEFDREGEVRELDVVLGYRAVFDAFDRNQRMSGPTSRRRTGFAQVIQHTIPLPPDALGGPLLNLDGDVIGINIARVDRVTTYALPADQVKQALAVLRRSAAQESAAKP